MDEALRQRLFEILDAEQAVTFVHEDVRGSVAVQVVEVNQSGVGDGRVFKLQLSKLAEPLQVNQTHARR